MSVCSQGVPANHAVRGTAARLRFGLTLKGLVWAAARNGRPFGNIVIESDDDILHLYQAIGFIMVQWSFIEGALDTAISIIYTYCGGNTLRKTVPKFPRDKHPFIRHAVATLPKLTIFKMQAEHLLCSIDTLKSLRNNFAHSVPTSLSHSNGIFPFARLDAKTHTHEVQRWQFDVRTFPETAAQLQALVEEAQEFAKVLQEAAQK